MARQGLIILKIALRVLGVIEGVVTKRTWAVFIFAKHVLYSTNKDCK